MSVWVRELLLPEREKQPLSPSSITISKQLLGRRQTERERVGVREAGKKREREMDHSLKLDWNLN